MIMNAGNICTERPIAEACDESEYRVNRDLIVWEDTLRLKDFSKGYAVAKKDAARINQIYYDIAVGHLDDDRSVPDFYNIPILSCGSDDDEDICQFVLGQFHDSGKRRYFLWVPDVEIPLLLDVSRIGGLEVLSAEYLSVNSQILSKEGKQEKRFKRYLDSIAEELSCAK